MEPRESAPADREGIPEIVEVRMFRFTLLLAFSLFTLSPSRAAVLTVSADGAGPFPTIQAAVDAAQEGDTITLADGIYRGPGNRDIQVAGKEVIIRSAGSDPARCTLDCEGLGRGISFDDACRRSTQLRSLTITRGKAESGGAVHCNHGAPMFVDCRFLDNVAEKSGGAVHSEGSSARFEHSCWRATARR